jgi:hypothetical protein
MVCFGCGHGFRGGVQGYTCVCELAVDNSAAGIVRTEPDDPCAETRFRVSEKRTSPFKSAGVSAQSAGRRLC